MVQDYRSLTPWHLRVLPFQEQWRIVVVNSAEQVTATTPTTYSDPYIANTVMAQTLKSNPTMSLTTPAPGLWSAIVKYYLLSNDTLIFTTVPVPEKSIAKAAAKILSESLSSRLNRI